MGGFVVSANLYQTTAPNGANVPEGSIVIRVPAKRVEEALTQIKADVVEIRNETRTGQDVTQEYVDLESRLKNLQAAEAQLTRFMEEAKKTFRPEFLNRLDDIIVFRSLTKPDLIEILDGAVEISVLRKQLAALVIGNGIIRIALDFSVELLDGRIV